MPRHPSQLYEAILEGRSCSSSLAGAPFQSARRIVLWTFTAMYGLFRTFVEFFREPDQQVGYILGFLTEGQMLSIPLILLGTIMIFIWLRKKTSGRRPLINFFHISRTL